MIDQQRGAERIPRLLTMPVPVVFLYRPALSTATISPKHRHMAALWGRRDRGQVAGAGTTIRTPFPGCLALVSPLAIMLSLLRGPAKPACSQHEPRSVPASYGSGTLLSDGI
ncbi:hypothetical protein JM66_07420 [Aeromonas bestiarum]|nr:hypothetical protein JM66_07420 [Aeromonas bestiarum]